MRIVYIQINSEDSENESTLSININKTLLIQLCSLDQSTLALLTQQHFECNILDRPLIKCTIVEFTNK